MLCISVFFFFSWKKKGVEAIFCLFLGFFHGQKSCFTPVFSWFFTPTVFFHARVFLFFSRAKSRFSRAKFQEFSLLLTYSWKWYNFRRIDADQLDFSKYFHGHFLVFTGVIFDFFHVHDFHFHGCKSTKFFTGKIGFFTGKLPYFSRPADLASRPKKKHCCHQCNLVSRHIFGLFWRSLKKAPSSFSWF